MTGNATPKPRHRFVQWGQRLRAWLGGVTGAPGRAAQHEPLAQYARTVPGVMYQFRRWPDGRMSLPFASPRIEELFGVTPERAAEDMRFVNERVHPDDLAGLLDGIEVSATHLTPWYHEFRVQHPVRGLIWIRAMSTPMAEPEGGILWHGFMFDITDSKRAEARLRFSEERHRLLADSSADIIWTMGLDGKYTYLSPSVEKIRGYTAEEIINMAWEDAFTPASLAIAQEGFALALTRVAAGLPVRFHERLEERCKDGSTVWTEVKATSLYDRDGQFVEILGIDRDITEQKRIEDELRATKERLEATLNALPDLLFRVDRDGRIQECHAANPLLYYQPREHFLGKRWDEVVPAEAAQVIMAALKESATQGMHTGAVYSLPLPGGQAWFEMSIAPMRHGDAVPDDFIVLVRDITRRKAAEEQLRLSEERHRLLAENARDTIWTMELDGTISYVSRAVEAVRGYTPEEAMRQAIEEIHTPDSQGVSMEYFAKLQADIQAGRKPENFRGELEYKCKDGSTFWTEVLAFPLLRDDGTFQQLLGVSRDISERKRYELELQQARDAANEANQAKSRFLAHMSHEIRTPMNGVLGLAQILAREPLSSDQQQMVENILVAGKSLLSIINDILDLSKIEAGQLQLDPQPFDLQRTLAHIVSIASVTAGGKGLDLRLDAAPELAGRWLGDGLRLEQVLFNLVGNAVKFTGQGAVTLRVRPLELSATRGRLRFEIQDTGIGMDADTVGRLFTPFTQAGAGIARRFGGTGLGLSISKRLVEMMGGVIGVHSTPGEGSCFWFEWLGERLAGAESSDPVSANDTVVTPEASGPRLAGLRVLVADDSVINRMVVERALSLEGATCSLANDGEQALQVLADRPRDFDVVLMDIQMPVMDGLTATRAIRQRPELAGLPVLALSAGVLAEEQEAALAAGMDDFINKPIELKLMTATLARYVKPAMGAGGQCAG